MQTQIPGAFPDADRDEYGLTQADYERLMNEIDGKSSCGSMRC